MILKWLCSNKNIIAQKVTKELRFFLVDKADYVKRMKELLTDASKFKEITAEPGKEINILLLFEGKLMSLCRSKKFFYHGFSLQLYWKYHSSNGVFNVF